MKYVKLVTNAEVNGVLRSPVEPPIHLEDKEANRLIAAKLGRDVTAQVEGRRKPAPRRRASAPASKAPPAKKAAPPKKAQAKPARPPAETPPAKPADAD